MSTHELISCPSDDALAATVADRWLAALAAGPDPFCAALCGGRIARKFFRAVAVAAPSRPGVIERVHFFWGDERCVPPDDPESNFGVARDLMLGPLQIAADRIHRVRGEIAPEWAAAEAEAEICRIAPLTAGGEPVLDLILLGMGEDGHVASLFPGGAPTTSRAAYFPVIASKPPAQRISMGFATIAAAREVWVLASGPGKEAALKESLSTNGKTPLARVLASRSRTLVFTDLPVARPA